MDTFERIKRESISAERWAVARQVGLWAIVLTLMGMVVVLLLRDYYQQEALDLQRQQVIECAKPEEEHALEAWLNTQHFRRIGVGVGPAVNGGWLIVVDVIRH